MGCICSKGTRANDYVENNHRKKDKAHKDSGKTTKKLSVPSQRENVVVEADASALLISNEQPNHNAGSAPASSSEDDENKAALAVVERSKRTSSQLQRRTTMDVGMWGGQGQPRMPRIMGSTGGKKGAQVVAGWPSWLAAVAGEAINGWIPRTADSFEKLEKVRTLLYLSLLIHL